MTTTYSTDAQVNARDTLGYVALSVYSAAAVARGESAITTYDALRVEAKRQILIALRGRGITESDITDSEALQTVEEALTLALLFAAVAQWTNDQPDIYALKAAQYRKLYDDEIGTVNPISNVRGSGSSFSWGRG